MCQIVVPDRVRPKTNEAGRSSLIARPRLCVLRFRCVLHDLDVPGLVAHAERILLRVSDIQVAEVDEAFEFIGFRESLAEVLSAEALLADVEITDPA